MLPLVTALAAHATLLAVIVVLKARSQRSPYVVCDPVYFWSSLASSAVAASTLAVAATAHEANLLGGYWVWLGLVWLALSLLTTRSGLFAVFQTALLVAVAHFVASWLQRQPWYALAAEPLLDARCWQAEALAFAAVGLVWSIVRILLRQPATISPLDGVSAPSLAHRPGVRCWNHGALPSIDWRRGYRWRCCSDYRFMQRGQASRAKSMAPD